MSSRLAMARFASPMSQGKYCRALISSVTAHASSKGMARAAAPSWSCRYSSRATKAAIVALLDEPLEARQEGRALVLESSQARVEPPRLVGGPVDRLHAAVLVHQVEERLGQRVVRRGQHVVHRLQVGGPHPQPGAQVVSGGHDSSFIHAANFSCSPSSMR